MRCRLRCPLACSSPARRLSQRVGRGFYFRAARTEPPHPAADSTFLPASSPNTPQPLPALPWSRASALHRAERRCCAQARRARSTPNCFSRARAPAVQRLSGNNWSAASSSVHGSCTAQALPPVPAPELTCGPRATFLWHDVHATLRIQSLGTQRRPRSRPVVSSVCSYRCERARCIQPSVCAHASRRSLQRRRP
ncbi:hypothetical protein B0H14DRAFT_178960 [Mycena olivaceomarginata]|nr:hypothetical protein B0H14DRAFT_178960 [Mycena olivaceomarginata]